MSLLGANPDNESGALSSPCDKRFLTPFPAQIVFLGEGGDHLAGARGVLIHEQNDPPVEFLWPQPLST